MTLLGNFVDNDTKVQVAIQTEAKSLVGHERREMNATEGVVAIVEETTAAIRSVRISPSVSYCEHWLDTPRRLEHLELQYTLTSYDI